MKYIFTAINDDEVNVATFSAPTLEMLEEKVGAFGRANKAYSV